MPVLNYLTPSPNMYRFSLASLFTALTGRKFKNYDFIKVTDEPGNLYVGNGVDAPDALLPLQTAAKHHRAVAKNATAAITAAELKKGMITGTSAAATTLTLPTATLFATAIGAKRGTWFDFAVDNSAGANAITLAVNTGITAVTAVITGSDSLVVATGAVGLFRIYFTSGTVAKIARIQ